MAKYLSNIDLSKNQLQNAALHPVGTAPASPVEGQVYFDTSVGDKKMYYWDGSSWIFMGSQGDITSISSNTLAQLTVTNGGGPNPSLTIVTGAVTSSSTALATGAQIYSFVTGLGYVESVGVNNSTFINLVDSGTATDPDLTASLSATGTPGAGNFLRGDNTWATPDYYTNADVDAHLNTSTATSGQILSWTGTDYDWINNQVGDITEVLAGTYLNGGGSSGSVTLNHDSTSRTDTTSTASPAHGGTFTAVDSVTTNATGHVTAINVKTVTLPADDDTTYDLSGFGSTNGTAGVQLVGSDATTDQVDITGAGTTTVTHSSNTITITSNDQYDGTVTSIATPADGGLTGGTITTSGSLRLKNYAALSDSTVMGWDNTNNQLENAPMTYSGNNVTITGDLTVSGGDITLSGTGRIQGIDTITAATDAVNKNYVDNAVVGNLVYQGGYNAATNTPDLDSSPSSSIKKGWTYTVTADGSFFTEQVRVGDVLIAEVDAPTALADWTTVQNNIDIASSSQIGIGNVVEGEGINVSYSNGTATVSGENSSATNKGIVIVSAGTGISVAYSSGTATVTNTETNSSNTDSGQITAGSTSGTVTHNFGTTNVIVQTYLDNATDNYPTVFCDVTRASNSVTATIATAESDDIIILVQKIG